MPATNQAADAGLLDDRLADIQTGLDSRPSVAKAQTFTAGQKQQARSNIGAQAADPDLDAVIAAATTGNARRALYIDATGAITTAPLRRSITLWSNSLGTTTWASMPSGVTELLGKTTARTRADLSQYTQARLTVGMGATSGAAGSGLAIQYSTDQATWKYLDDVATVTVGTTGPSSSLVPATAGYATAGAWVTIAANARADVWLRVIGTGGSGSTSPIIGSVILHLA